MASATVAVVSAAVTARLVRRVAVVGDSMRPALEPGDKVLAVRTARAVAGDLVVVRDPRSPGRLLVKRVAEVGPAGVVVLGDNQAVSTDSRAFGPVPAIWGRAVYRYAPAARAGRLRDPGGRGDRER